MHSQQGLKSDFTGTVHNRAKRHLKIKYEHMMQSYMQLSSVICFHLRRTALLTYLWVMSTMFKLVVFIGHTCKHRHFSGKMCLSFGRWSLNPLSSYRMPSKHIECHRNVRDSSKRCVFVLKTN
jgi:hypothetical protein